MGSGEPKTRDVSTATNDRRAPSTVVSAAAARAFDPAGKVANATAQISSNVFFIAPTLPRFEFPEIHGVGDLSQPAVARL